MDINTTVDNKPLILNVVMEDGTSISELPKNPLLSKWEEKYMYRHGNKCSTVLGYQEDGRPIMNYSCVLCYEDCPHSDNWKVPDEDMEEYNKWRESVKEFYRAHSPKLYNQMYCN